MTEEKLGLTGESRISDYCRWESGSRAEEVRVLAGWLEDLERVGAEIENVACDPGGSEVSFTMTLRQAFEIGWSWDSILDRDAYEYLAEHLAGVGLMTESEIKSAAPEIEALWSQWTTEKAK